MANFANGIKNNDIQHLAVQAGRRVTGAIERASARTGVDFSYLMKQAQVESSFNPSAKARTSSASGLFQFIESTWLEMVNKYGEKYGIPANAPKRQVLALRNDPEKAALMAAEFAAENRQTLESCLGETCKIGDTEMYLAHFLGAKGAVNFLKEYNENPQQSGAALFPQAARSNRNVFYNEAGRPKTLEAIYDKFARKLGAGEVEKTIVTEAAPVADQVDMAAMLNFYPGVAQYRPSVSPMANVNGWSNLYRQAPAQPALFTSNWMRNYAVNPVEIMQISQAAYQGRYNA